MADKKEDLSLVTYTLGIIGIVMAFISAYGLGGIIFGIVGLILGKKLNTDLSKKARKLNIASIIVGIIFFIFSILVALFLPTNFLQ